MRHKQLPLAFDFHSPASLANFVRGDNEDVVTLLRGMAAGVTREPYLFLWGTLGVGKTHLLHGCCQRMAERGLPVSYFSLTQRETLSPAVLDNLQQQTLIALDDVDAIVGQQQWEMALFNLYNLVAQTRASLLMSANCPPGALACWLPDLQSRLTASLVYQIKSPDDLGKRQILIERASELGLVLPVTVADYLLQHYSRDLADLMAMLARLDQASLVSQRALTIPFVKTICGLS
jgi:DnaA-homolog protein